MDFEKNNDTEGSAFYPEHIAHFVLSNFYFSIFM